LDELQRRPPDRAAAFALFRELEFTNLSNEFADAAQPVATTERNYSMVANQRDLAALVDKLWQAETIGVALSNSLPPGAGQQQSVRDEHGANGIAFSLKAG